MFRFITVLACLFLLECSYAAEPRDSVKTTVENLFKAMRTSDPVLLRECFADSAILQTIAINRTTGQTRIVSTPVNAFVAQIEKLPKDSADERIVFETVKVDADIATVWTPYQFFYNGRFSHCGVNCFTLVRLAGQWKIQYLIDTRRKTNCL